MNKTISENANFQMFETWDLRLPVISPRTILYALRPVGIGTSEVESLTSYITRLAAKHYLSPVTLLKNSVPDISLLPTGLRQDSINSTFGGSLNGFGKNTKDVVEILQKATSQSEIYHTTLLHWKGKMSNQKLLKKNMAWCSLCYELQSEKREIIYDKLIWTFEQVKVCQIHKLPLTEKCPHCHKKLKLLSGKSRCGYCSKCLGWLGSKSALYEQLGRFVGNEAEDLEIWRAIKIGELLARSSPIFTRKSLYIFIDNLQNLIRTFTYGSINDFAHKTHIWHVAIRRLLKSEVLPTVDLLLNICFPFGVSPVELFVWHSKFKDEAVTLPINNNKPCTKDEAKNYIDAFLSEYPPPSANEVARRIVWTTTRLQRNFPDHYKQVVKRYSEHTKRKLPQHTDEEVQTILTKAGKETPPPSLQSVFRSIGCRSTGYRYYKKFPELCSIITERHQKANNKKFNVENAEKVMRLALQEAPPPSFSEVARRLKSGRDTLDRKLPQLSKLLHKRYKDYLNESMLNNHQELYLVVRDAVTKLQKNGSSISENNIKKNLSRGWNDKVFKETYRRVINEFSAES